MEIMATAGASDVVCNLVQKGNLILPRKAGLDPIYNGISISGDILMVSDRDACNVTLHSRHDGTLLATSDKLEQWACGICIINDIEICVALWNSTIEIMSVKCTGDTAVITKVRTLHVNTTFDECHGVSKFMDKIVVCGRKQTTMCWCTVSLVDGQVDTIHKICNGDWWSHLTTKQTMIYISCWANSPDTGVYAYDIRNPSKQKFTYKHSDLAYPTGITVDAKGFIFVCNNRPPCIHHLTDRYELVKIYREGMPWDPQGSYLRDIFWGHQHGLLYLTCWRTNVITILRPEYSNQGEETDEVDSNDAEEVLPPEILRMDDSFQKLYRGVLATGKEKVYNIRVMIVGHQGVGKTSLTKRLLGEQVKENGTESTEGIETHVRCSQIDHATGKWKRKDKRDDLILNDQRIANILCKYTNLNNNQDIMKTVSVNVTPTVNGTPPANGTPPTKKPRLDVENVNKVYPFSKDITQLEHNESNLPGAIIEERKEGSYEREITYPEEIKNFVERAQYMSTLKSSSSDVTLLDFAGQSLFYTTHQAFMSWRTLYLLVTDMSLPLTDVVEDGEYGIDGNISYSIQEHVTYWLNSIHSHVNIPNMMHTEGSSGSVQGTTINHPFVFLVGTHSDKIPKDLLNERKRTYFQDIRTVLKKSPLRFHLIDEDFAITNLGSDPNINSLKSKIFEIAKKQKYWGEEIPARWIPLARALMELKNRGIPVMDYDDVKSVNETLQVRIERPEELDLFLRFEHDMGNIVFFSTERLRKKVVLDPEWLIHGVKIWITSDQVIKRHPELSEQWFAFKNTGRLTSTLIEKLWSSHSEIHEHKEHLLDVMEKLNIIAKPLQTEGEDYYWVPCMVCMPAPDDVKKLEHNKDATKTSTLCFRSKANFIHVGVYHRLLATCLSKWTPAKEGNRYLLFRALCVFDVDEQHQLLLSLNDFVIHATVIRWTIQGRIPDLPLCMNIREDLYTTLSDISDYLCPGSELEICIKCRESSPLSNEGLHSVTILRDKDELRFSDHKEPHCVESKGLLRFWEEGMKQIPANVLTQHLTQERFTRLSSLVLDVGSKILREVLTYYTTASKCTLDQYMKQKGPDIRNLRKGKVLTLAQMAIIFPQSGQTDINQYDITLASTLLTNIYSLGKQENDIIRDLRTQRNELAHSNSTKMSEQDFQTKWTEITTTLTDLSKLCKDPNFDNQIQKEILDIQQSPLGVIVSKVNEITKELENVRKMLPENQTT